MSDSTTIKEVRAKFTADLSEYRKAMQQAAKPTQELKAQIAQMQEEIKRTGALYTAQGQKMNQALTSAGRAADTLGKRTETLTTKQRQLSRSIENQQQKLAQLKDEYAATQTGKTGLEEVFQRIQSAAQGLDLSTPLAQQQAQVAQQMQAYEAEIEALKRNLSNAGSASLVELPNGGFASLTEARQHLTEITQAADEAAKKMWQLDEAAKKIGAENMSYASAAGLKQLQSEIAKDNQHMEQLKVQAAQAASKLNQLGESSVQNASELDSTASKVDELGNELNNLGSKTGKLDGLKNKFSGLRGVLGKVTTVARGVASGLGKAATASLKMTGLSGLASKIKGIGTSASSSTGGVEKLLSSIKRIGVVSLGLKIATGLFGRLRSVISSYVSSNETLSNTVERLKNGLGQALAPAINIVINAMQRLLPYVIGVADAIGTLLTNLFGKGWTTVASGASSAASATDSATAAQEKYNKTLAGFDEITKLDDNSSSGSSGGGGGGSTGSTTTAMTGQLPAWLTDITGQIKELLAAEDFTGIGSLLANKFGELVDSAREKLNNAEFREKVSKMCSRVTDVINGFFDTASLGDANSIATNFGALIGDGVGLALNTIDQFLTGVHWSNIGRTLAQNINGALASMSSNAVNFGTVIAHWMQAHIDGIGGFFDELNWRGIGEAIASNINSMLYNFDFGDLTSAISSGIAGALTTAASAMEGLDWDQLARSARDCIFGIKWGDITSALSEAFGAALAGAAKLFQAPNELLVDALEEAVGYFMGEIEDVGGNILLGILNGIMDAIIGIGDWIQEHILEPFVDGVKGVFGIASPAKNPEIVSLGSYIVQGMFNGITEWMGGITGWVKQKIMQPVKNAIKRLGSVTLEITNKLKNTASELWKKFKSAWGNASSKVVEVANKLKNTASNLWSGFKSAWGSASSKVVEIANNLKNKASSLWNSFKSAWSGSSDGVTVKDTLTTSGQSLWNTLSSQWGNRSVGVNAAVGSKIKIKDLVSNESLKVAASYGAHLLGNLTFTKMATGGIITAETLFGGGVVAGEAGKEAIVPLDRNTGWADNVAKRMNELSDKKDTNQQNSGTSTTVVHNYVQLDGRTVWKNTVQYAQADAKRGEYPLAGCV